VADAAGAYLANAARLQALCGLLTSNFCGGPGTVALAKESIGHISNGSSFHSDGALKLGLKKVFELKKQQRAVPSQRNSPATYSCVR